MSSIPFGNSSATPATHGQRPVPAPAPAAAGIGQLLRAVRRRAVPMASTFAGLLLAAILAAVLWPPTYRSTGTILIEQQEVPTDFVRSAVTSYADQRVQMITQRVMTSANLLGIIDKYDLYPRLRDTSTREKLTERMRRDVGLNMISAEVMDPRQGRATKATIAFSVSYENRSPVLAARVANELTTLYLSENIESRRQLAVSATDFLAEEAERLGRNVAALEQRLAAFKTENGERLPEFQQFNLQTLEGGRQELRDIEARIRSLDQQLVFLDSQLALLDPTGAAYTEDGQRVLSSRDRLKVLRSQLASARALYGDAHPDVQRHEREIAGLEAQLGIGAAGDARNDVARRLTEARAQLGSLQQRFTLDHPDVLRLQTEVAGLERSLAALPASASASARAASAPDLAATADADNPAWVQLRAQRAAAASERRSLQEQMAQVRTRMADIQARQAAAPAVEQEYSELQRDLQNERLKYAEVRQKQLEAQLVQNLETERKGERFTLIEPPMQPTQPVTPNRGLVMLLGMVLAAGATFAVVFLLEQLDTSIRDRAHLVQLLGVPPLAVVPRVQREADLTRRRRRVRWVVGALLVAAVAAMLALHFFVRPLDLLWMTLLRRFA